MWPCWKRRAVFQTAWIGELRSTTANGELWRFHVRWVGATLIRHVVGGRIACTFMKIVPSRKGFDSVSGGSLSPITRGRPTSIPIPARDRSETTYGDLALCAVVQRVTGGRLTAANLRHHDPVFERGRCAFGQTGAGQSHLANNDVGVGDVFLFFGLFSGCDGDDPHQRIFGYLRVAEMTKLGAEPAPSSQPRAFSHGAIRTLLGGIGSSSAKTPRFYDPDDVLVGPVAGQQGDADQPIHRRPKYRPFVLSQLAANSSFGRCGS